MSVRALGDIGDHRVVDALIAILDDEKTIDCSHLRLETCWALRKLKDPRAIESLIKILENHRKTTYGLEDAAASALVELDDDRIELPLLRYFSGKLDMMIKSKESMQDEQQQQVPERVSETACQTNSQVLKHTMGLARVNGIRTVCQLPESGRL